MTRHKLIQLPVRSGNTGSLCFAQEPDDIPFQVRRIFYLYDISPDATRGRHAHREQQQMLIMMAGGCSVTVDDGNERTTLRIAEPSMALYVPPMLWLDLTDFEPGSVCAVLASDVYDETDYIRDYEKFLLITRGASALA